MKANSFFYSVYSKISTLQTGVWLDIQMHKGRFHLKHCGNVAIPATKAFISRNTANRTVQNVSYKTHNPVTDLSYSLLHVAEAFQKR